MEVTVWSVDERLLCGAGGTSPSDDAVGCIASHLYTFSSATAASDRTRNELPERLRHTCDWFSRW
eukprot:8822555-Pyramimonas_sp.AAC.1